MKKKLLNKKEKAILLRNIDSGEISIQEAFKNDQRILKVIMVSTETAIEEINGYINWPSGKTATKAEYDEYRLLNPDDNFKISFL